jgi:hypothetical protein
MFYWSQEIGLESLNRARGFFVWSPSVKLALEIMGVCAFSEFFELKLTPAT